MSEVKKEEEKQKEEVKKEEQEKKDQEIKPEEKKKEENKEDLDAYKKHPKIKCPICGAEMHPRSLKRHMELMHGIKDTKAEKPEIVVTKEEKKEKEEAKEGEQETEILELEEGTLSKVKKFFTKWKYIITFIVLAVVLTIIIALKRKRVKHESANKQ
jgi:hypothetical protein